MTDGQRSLTSLDMSMTCEKCRITPSKWGKSLIMIDELEVEKYMSELLGRACKADEDPNDRPKEVHITRDRTGAFYACRMNEYRRCQNPDKAKNGCIEFLDDDWKMFDNMISDGRPGDRVCHFPVIDCPYLSNYQGDIPCWACRPSK